MPIGIHSFYVFPRTHNLVDNPADYFIGSFIGDHFNDEVFAEKLRRIEQKIYAKFGWRCTYFWSPGIVKPYKPLTAEQKYKRAITKASNIHKKNSLQIIQDNTLFTNDFLYEEINRHHERVDVLKARYNQINADQ